jgi:putative phosphoesterase
MRLLAFSDIHGSYHKVDEILVKESVFDAVIIAGDLTTVGSTREAEEAILRFQLHSKPIFAVAGNMDLPEIENSLTRLGVSINARGLTCEQVGLFGVSASPFTPMKTPYEISEEEIERRTESGWKDIASARWKIFVPHAPPHDTKLDRVMTGMHVGSTAVRKAIVKYQPDLVVCGHIHEARGVDTIGKTTIVNCGPAGKGYYVAIEIGTTLTVELRG